MVIEPLTELDYNVGCNQIAKVEVIDRFHSRDHKLSNRCHAAILVDKQTESRFTVKMVFCMIVGCGSQSGTIPFKRVQTNSVELF